MAHIFANSKKGKEAMFQNITPDCIRKLHRIAQQLEKISVDLPSKKDAQNAKTEIERILTPPQKGYVTLPYATGVLIALKYAMGHVHQKSGSTLLNDIKTGERIVLSQYRSSAV